MIQIWLRLRGQLLRGYGVISRKNPRFARVLRQCLRPLVQTMDASAFRLRRKAGHRHSAQTGDETRRYQQTGIPLEGRPLVSIIVPNYNHAPYLQQRLESIYAQSYDHYEVILLDDGSQDDSVAVLKSFRQRYPERTQLVVNEANSGGVFHQWAKGIRRAQGEIIWIAESDDYCTPDFLATLIPYFRNEAVMLAYANTEFIRNQDTRPFRSIREYLHDIDPDRWNAPFVATAHQLVQTGFAIKNIIPNASSALFRNIRELEILDDAEWKAMRTCGDWLFYLHVIRGGMVAYSPEATNYYRIHDRNTSVTSHAQDGFYREHETIARMLLRYYDLPTTLLLKQQQQLVAHWQQARDDYSEARFSAAYDVERAIAEAPPRVPNLLMAGYGFHAGGGETFPILLANLMKAQGYNVTFLDCNQTRRVEAVRESLRRDIPVVTELSALNAIVADFGIDLMHSHHVWVDQAILNLLATDSRARMVVSMHGMYELLPAKEAQRTLEDLAARKAQLVYTAEKNLTPRGGEALLHQLAPTRIDNALDVFPVTPIARESIGVPASAFLLTLVSRAVEDKGWYEAIAAVTHARELSGKDIHLFLIGEGAVYDALHRAPPADYIHLAGYKRNIRDYFAASQLGLLPTRFKGESFPLVVIDCLHAGTPVLASAVGEIPYMLKTDKGDAGICFPLDEDWRLDTDALAQHIAELASNTEAYARLQAHVSAAAEKFSPDRLCTAYDAVYRNALRTE